MTTDTQEEQNAANEQDQESFTNLDPASLSPELQEIYKSMQAGFTKKTQEFSDRTKEFTTKEQKWEEGLKTFGAVEQENKKWHEWYQNLQEEDGSDKEAQPDITAEQSPEIREVLKQFQDSQSSSVNNLQQEIDGLKAALKNTTDQTSRMFNYQSQLGDLEKEYTNIDKQKVLDHALQTGQPDLKKAYSDLYHDDLLEHEVQKRLAEELAKQRTQGIRSNAQQIIVKSKNNAPKSFAQATEQIVNSY